MAATATDPEQVTRAIQQYGLALFPLPEGSKAAEPGWQQQCTRDIDEATAWLHAGHNVGIGCRASNVVVLDLDCHDDGPDGITMFRELCEQAGQGWPATLTVRTPRLGKHLYFRRPAGRIIGSTSGHRSPFGRGIDTRGPGRHSGGYVVGPGSVTSAGQYHILYGHPIAELPAWLADRLELGKGGTR